MSSVLSVNLPHLVRTALASNFCVQLASQRLIHLSNVDLRARRGTREKQKKKKVKIEVKKLDYYAKLALTKGKNKSKVSDNPIDDSEFPLSCDDAYEIAKYKTKLYTVEDAIQNLREVNDPSVNNNPNAYISASIEINMQAAKKTRTLENFSKLVLINHGFLESQDRKILVFCKNNELQDVARKAGASLVGGTELIKSIQKGELKLVDYRYILAHPDIIMDIIPLRGLLKKKFPSVEAGSINAELDHMISRYMNGIEYRAVKQEFDPKFGIVNTTFGRLSMPMEHLLDNFVTLLKDVESNRPKRDGLFVSRCFLKTDTLESELFKTDPFAYIKREEMSKHVEVEEPTAPKVQVDSDDEDNVKASNKG